MSPTRQAFERSLPGTLPAGGPRTFVRNGPAGGAVIVRPVGLVTRRVTATMGSVLRSAACCGYHAPHESRGRRPRPTLSPRAQAAARRDDLGDRGIHPRPVAADAGGARARRATAGGGDGTDG